MKKLLLLLCVPMMFSCGEKKIEKDDINELKNKINNLEHELNDCKEVIESLEDSLRLEIMYNGFDGE